MGIINRYPKDDEFTLYILSDDATSIDDLLAQAGAHFGECDIRDLYITSEYIHTRAITYDLYDSSDYDNYIVIRKR